MRLSPPQIESKLPAFINGVINIPFNLNRSVGRDEVGGLQLLIKSVQTNELKARLTTSTFYEQQNTKGYFASFGMTWIDDRNKTQTFVPVIGQYYKVQLACLDKTQEVGYYSAVGIIKCTAAPIIEFNQKNLIRNTYEYTVTAKQDSGIDKNGNPLGDITEKIYSYCFKLYDENNKMIATSGEQIHNTNKDINSYEQIDTWTLRKALDANVTYTLEYSATTTNGYKAGPVYKTILDGETVPPNVHASLVADAYPDDGYINLLLVGNGDKVKVSGSFILIRSSSEDNFDSWYPMTKFALTQWDTSTIKEICRDYSIQQGVEYQYAIQSYNDAGLYSNRMLSNNVVCDFEDAFLYDGERQLKIKFNPKISSFKSTILESKTNTIGGKYPFIFRNGNVEYKEFQISGLISTLIDENNEFKFDLYLNNKKERDKTPSTKFIEDTTTWLTGDNYYRERQFKLAVLDWLNDGKPKLFRSPAEGNYIVRLMNVTLSPNDILGRMLHTFTCSATEIAAPTFDNFYNYGFVVEDYIETRDIRIEQIDLNNIPVNMLREDGAIMLPGACMAAITANNNTKIEYTLINSTSPVSQDLGDTGNYYFPEEVLKETPLMSIKLLDDRGWGKQAFLTYGYYDKISNDFSLIRDIKITDEMTQIPGKGIIYDNKNNIIGNNIIKDLEDIRTKTGRFHYLKVETKIVQTITWNNTKQKYQFDPTAELEIWNSRTLYKVIGENYVVFFDGNNPPPNKPPFINGQINEEIKEYALYSNDHLYDFKLNDDPVIDFSGNKNTDGRYSALRDIESISSLYVGKGLILDVVYQKKEITYTIEVGENNYINKLKEDWLIKKQNYINSPTKEAKKNMDKAYSMYIQNLENALNKEAAQYDIEFAI